MSIEFESRQLFNFLQGSDITGESAFDIWKALTGNNDKNAFVEYLKGENGADGKSAYQSWLDAGNTGSEADFVNTHKVYTDTAITTHNAATDAHNDIRELITGLTTRLNTLANSDDTTLDQMAEVVAYIKSNKSLIESITTNKVNVSDIVNDLTTNATDKPLSAAQGVAIKALIDESGNAETALNNAKSYTDEKVLDVKDYIESKLELTDTTTGIKYALTVTDGTLSLVRVSATESELQDLAYTANEDGTYTITGWNGTKNGVESTEFVVPNYSNIIVDIEN
jgi:hypothetical protein